MAKLAKDLTIYSLGTILNKGVMFLLVPLYTRVLVPADYGKLELVNTVGAILVMLYGLMVENGYARMYFQSREIDKRKELFFSGQLFNIVCSLVFGGISFIYAESIAANIFKFPGGADFLRLITVVTFLKVLTHIPFHNIRNRQKAALFVSMNLGYLILNVALTIIMLVVLKLGVKGVLYAQIISGTIELLALYYVTREENGLKYSLASLKMMLGFSVFLIPANLSGFILNLSNRYFLNEYQDLEQVGLYSLGAKLSGIIPFLFTDPVKRAFGPHFYKLMDQPERSKKLLADFSRVFFAGLALVALTISVFSRELVELMASASYGGSHSIVFILSTSYLFLGLAGVIVIGVHVTMKTWIISLIWLVSAGINVLLNILLIPAYGRMGAALATMLSVVFINISYFYAVSRIYPVKFEYLKYLQVLLMMIAVNITATQIHLDLGWRIVLKLALLLLFAGILVVTGYFTDSEKAKAAQAIKSARHFALSFIEKLGFNPRNKS